MYRLMILSVAPVLPALGILFIGVKRTKFYRDLWLYLIAMGIAFSPVGIYYAWDVNAIYGMVYILCSYSAVLIFALRLFDKLPYEKNWLLLTSLIVTAVAFISVVPTGILPKLRPVLVTPHETLKPEKGLDLDFVSQSLAKITQAMSSTVTGIESEQNKVKVAIDELLSDLKDRNKELSDLQKEQKRLIEEVEHYKALASLTEEQADAVRIDLARGKYVDYIIGFLIGIISSAAVAFGARMSFRMQGAQKMSSNKTNATDACNSRG